MHHINRRPAEECTKDFDEVDQGLPKSTAVLEARRCMDCPRPKCVEGCPVGIDIPGFIKEVADGHFRKASRILKADNMLPAICGRVCPQEHQCEGMCILGIKDKPIAIGQIERFIADWEAEAGPELPPVAPSTGKQVAIVGSGPAGITAAAECAKAGHDVTIFESLHAPGGVLTYGIPNFRLPKDIVQREIDQVLELGATLKCNHIVGRSITADELLAYDAVFLGTGAGLPYFMGIPGENLGGVYSANEFLTRINLMHADRFPGYDTPVKKGQHVVVIGGGNVAMDSARVARRMDADVTLVYRRRQEDLPARAPETENAIIEGITFLCCANPVEILGEKKVDGIKCIKMEMCAVDASGRPSPQPMTGDEAHFTLKADVVIEAIGQGPNPLLVSLIPGLERAKKGNVVVDEDGRTSIPHVFAGGDIASGAATVIQAMGSAKHAAQAMNRMLAE